MTFIINWKKREKKKAKWEEKQLVGKSLGIVCINVSFTSLGIQRENPEGVSRTSIFEKIYLQNVTQSSIAIFSWQH